MAIELLNGGGEGSFSQELVNSGDLGVLRPFITKDENGNDAQFITVKNARSNDYETVRVQNAGIDTIRHTLSFKEWELVDTAVVQARQSRTQFYDTMSSSRLVRNMDNLYNHMTLQYPMESDIKGARIALDPIAEADNDQMEYKMDGMPLPVIFKNFSIRQRDLLISRNGKTPFDTTMVSRSTLKVMQDVESLLLGTKPVFTYAGTKLYGALNSPNRITADIRLYTTAGWTPKMFLDDIADMKQTLISNKYFGSFALFVAGDWDKYLDSDYNDTTSGTTSTITLRERLAKLDGLSYIQTCDFIPENKVLMLALDGTSYEVIKGFDTTAIMWQSHGGMKLNFAVVAMILPKVVHDFYGNCGIVEGVPA